MALSTLQPHVKDKTVVELGCGSGFFARQLQAAAKPKHITGIDFSGAAVARANAEATKIGLESTMNFKEGDCSKIDMPEADVTIGLGFLDYLAPHEIKALFERIKSKKILFTFSSTGFYLLRYVHIAYLKSQSCPKHFYYHEDELKELIGNKFGPLTVVSDRSMSFGRILHNL